MLAHANTCGSGFGQTLAGLLYEFVMGQRPATPTTLGRVEERSRKFRPRAEKLIVRPRGSELRLV